MAVALRRRQLSGPASDSEIEDFLYDALDLLPGASDVEVRCDSGRATLTGGVSQKRLKRDTGEIAWAIPGINDVQNNITIAPRRRARAANREAEPAMTGRKPA
jgi:osmotically-inducible protein OsmY